MEDLHDSHMGAMHNKMWKSKKGHLTSSRKNNANAKALNTK